MGNVVNIKKLTFGMQYARFRLMQCMPTKNSMINFATNIFFKLYEEKGLKILSLFNFLSTLPYQGEPLF